MKTISDRFSLFIDNQGFTNYFVEKKLGLSNGHLAKILKTPMPSFKILEKIYSTFPELSKSWLLTGVGEMLHSGYLLKKFRERIGFTKEQFCEKTGVDLDTLEKLEVGDLNIDDNVHMLDIQMAFMLFEPTIEENLREIEKGNLTVDLGDWKYSDCNDAELEAREIEFLEKRKDFWSKESVQKDEKIVNDFININSIWDDPKIEEYNKNERLNANTNIVEEKEVKEQKGIPVYNFDFLASISKFNNNEIIPRENVIGYMNFPEFTGADAIVKFKGNSLTGIIENGDWVALRKVSSIDLINFGDLYGIITTDNTPLIKFIRKGSTNDLVLLKSSNPDFDDYEIPKSKIKALFLVVDKASIKGLAN